MTFRSVDGAVVGIFLDSLGLTKVMHSHQREITWSLFWFVSIHFVINKNHSTMAGTEIIYPKNVGTSVAINFTLNLDYRHPWPLKKTKSWEPVFVRLFCRWESPEHVDHFMRLINLSNILVVSIKVCNVGLNITSLLLFSLSHT